MHPTLHLFYLIRNLDAAEVKYFRAYAKRKVKSGTSSALALFDLIFANEKYDDEAFEKAVNVGNFPALKVYLYEMIAEAMLEREMKRKGLTEIFALSQQAEMFQRKGLMDGMWRKMEKAMLLCERYEEFAAWRDLLRKKQTILMRDAGEGNIPEGMEDFDEIYPPIKEKARNLENFRDLEDQLEPARRKGDIATYECTLLLRDNPILSDSAPRLSNKAELRYSYLNRTIKKWSGDVQGTIKYSKLIIQIIETHPFLQLDNEFQAMYVGSIHHLGLYAAANREFDITLAAIEKLQSLKGLPVMVFERVHSLELQIAFETANFDMGLKVIKNIEEGLQLNSYKLSQERCVSYFFQVAHFFLFFSQPELALKWVLRLRDAKNPKTKKDLQDFGEILYLLCHFDLGNYKFIIRTEIEKAFNYLSKRGALSQYEDTIIKGLRKASKADSVKNRNRRLSRLNEALSKLREQPRFRHKGNYFQFDFWLQAKYSGESPISHLATAPTQMV